MDFVFSCLHSTLTLRVTSDVAVARRVDSAVHRQLMLKMCSTSMGGQTLRTRLGRIDDEVIQT